ncbi:MAG: hypothetical protein AB7N65_14065 [Vicinamibacterales bacterium]
MDLKRLLKRGALLAAANWQTVAIQFIAQTTFQVLLAVPITGAALMVAVLLGGDVANLFQGTLRDTFTNVASALTSEPIALVAFLMALGIVLLGGSVLMFLVKGGTMAVLIDANGHAGPIEADPLTYESLKSAARFTMTAFLDGCARHFRRYLTLGLLLMLVYLVSGAAYLTFVVYGYQFAAAHDLMIGWTFVTALSAVGLVLWITVVNLVYLLLQMVIAAEGVGLAQAGRTVLTFARAETRGLGGIFIVVLGIVVGASLASALAWSGVGLIAFVPLVGLAVFPLQIIALLIRGLVFEYIGLTALGAYLTLYRRHVLTRPADGRQPFESPLPSIT